ncbi:MULTISPECIES: hypothetical protein [Providencia]|uniref:Inner membrane protein yidI n=1 Tax=Providencia rettgeri TaxID=587 RepID=A0A427H9Q0_PRORE|nr:MULTISPECIES: hypothetical protein [Providencia]ELR5075312.1 hypothetical protein [Providencia stuartii]ELR5070054.1 hypothetical protein [Providencia rettgeri]ELR5215664.1 hypothetical protein [Providencia rettgeri]ELR5222200.1 hypothetical protein [Providencia rettgeri]MBV2187866.1 hypothetical protein [Providencia rettgeri]
MSMVHNRFSLIATIIGAFSILVILASQSFEREYAQSKPKIEQIVHEKVSSIKKATIDAIKGKKYQEPPVDEAKEQRQILLDKIELAKQLSITLGVFGIIFAAISFIRGENKNSGRIALALNGSVLAISLLLYAATGLAGIVAVLLVIWLIGNFFDIFSIC